MALCAIAWPVHVLASVAGSNAAQAKQDTLSGVLVCLTEDVRYFMNISLLRAAHPGRPSDSKPAANTGLL